MSKKSSLRYVSFAVAGVGLLFAAASVPASAATISWTTWSSNSTGAITPLGITVSYSGEMHGLSASGYPSWNPATTFSGGTVGNAPPSTGRMVTLVGGTSTVDTITFSSPVVNPVLAIWSLGAPGNQASFNFTATEPFAIQSGGPSAEYGGSSIVVCSSNPQAVCGAEGNGTLQFNGTYSQISWTNPVFENYYGFTVGAAGVASPQVPEPASLLLVASGLAGAALFRRRKA